MSKNVLAAVRPKILASTALAAVAVLGGTALAGNAASATAQPTTSPVAATAHAAVPKAHLKLHPSSAVLASCYPHAKADVDVTLTTDKIGKDTFTIKARGLKPRTDFTVFLIEKPNARFGAAEYIGDFTTNRHGRATNRFDLIVEEAFAFNNETGTRTDLDKVGVWFADPRDDNACIGNGGPVTGFDGDASAGVQMLNSGGWSLP